MPAGLDHPVGMRASACRNVMLLEGLAGSAAVSTLPGVMSDERADASTPHGIAQIRSIAFTS
jgi:hypothetical protein